MIQLPRTLALGFLARQSIGCMLALQMLRCCSMCVILSYATLSLSPSLQAASDSQLIGFLAMILRGSQRTNVLHKTRPIWGMNTSSASGSLLRIQGWQKDRRGKLLHTIR